jgi:hypothetical protein
MVKLDKKMEPIAKKGDFGHFVQKFTLKKT